MSTQKDADRLDFLVEEAIRVAQAPLPSDIAELAAQAIADAMICAIGGTQAPEAAASRRAFPDEGAVRIWGTQESRDPVTAAFVNGITAHTLDYDDWAPGSGAHPSVAIVPALLSASAGREVSGEKLLAAYAAAYELQERVGLSISPSHYEVGFHTTGIVGALGAACAASLVLGADRSQLRAAIAYAATGASGLKSVFGSAGKPLNAGNAASTGLRAALLAATGLAGPAADTVFGPQGLAPTHSSSVDEASLSQAFGEPWYIRSLLFKFSSACFGTHGAIMAAGLLKDAGVDVSRVRKVHITVPPITRTVCTIPDPKTGQEAKFSVAFTTAAALEGPILTASFAEPYSPSGTVRSLMDATTLTFDDSYAKTQTKVAVTLDDGIIRSAEANAGTPQWREHPREQRDALRAKAHDLCDAQIGSEGVDRLLGAAHRLASGQSAGILQEVIEGL
ncbi:MmgE/PrpD family protein [Microbacterium sp. CH12i]|uniref:MmgE/PrpD family protein n=1 Tax=Microbacterium sp. CH12i TaxID=1479651 RepID=UPI00068F1C9F|nr:MmgE/PrpD family protein [Microbacterium sp. CH12i]